MVTQMAKSGKNHNCSARLGTACWRIQPQSIGPSGCDSLTGLLRSGAPRSLIAWDCEMEPLTSSLVGAEHRRGGPMLRLLLVLAPVGIGTDALLYNGAYTQRT